MKEGFRLGWFLLAVSWAFACPSHARAAFRERSYPAAGNIELRYVIAAPSFESDRKYPLWIFQPGDGDIRDSFQPEVYRPMMEQFAQAFSVALVMPELRRNLYVNDLKRYCELDFFHRVDDASRLIDSAKGLSFVDPARVVLFGHSAGGEIVSLVAKARSDLWGVATYGTGVVSAGETGEHPPIGEEYLDNDCSDPAKYSLRSGKFWRQLFLESRLFSTIQSIRIPYLAMFGEKDSITPFDANEKLYSARLSGEKRSFSFQVFPGLDHGGYASSPAVFQQVKAWSNGAGQTGNEGGNVSTHP